MGTRCAFVVEASRSKRCRVDPVRSKVEHEKQKIRHNIGEKL
jgi:hypothetical protein